jgi:methanogenic corrinoid protein MtbC1
MMMVGRTSSRRAPAMHEPPPECTETEDVVELARLLLLHDPAIGIAFVDAARERGLSPQVICLELLAPTARKLGQMWEEDACDFMQVTLGLGRLHQVLHRMNAEFLPDADGALQPAVRRALLACVPGDQHTFGVVMVGQFLRREGWDVWSEFPLNNDELLDTVRGNSFTLVGLSVGSESRLEALKSAVRAVRRVSRNRSVCVMIGGPVLAKRPELASAVDADFSALDGKAVAAWVRTRFAFTAPAG